MRDVVLAEQELAVQVADFDVVVVSAVHLATGAAAESHQCKRLDVLAAERAGADHKRLDVAELVLDFASEHFDLVVVSRVERRPVYCACRQRLQDVVVQPLLERSVLACERYDFLSNDATEERSLRY